MNTPEPQAGELKAFLEQHSREYDPDEDYYERPPFAADIKEGKNDPIYNAHSYHTKVPPRSIIPYILHYTQPGDVVLDPFCGSGMTGVAAQMCVQPPADILDSFPELADRVGPRACILSDLSPAACHIAYNYNTPVDVAALKREFERIKAAVKDEFEWLYGTDHYEPAAGVYDVSNVDVTSRLKNPPDGKLKHNLLEEDERNWELLTKVEVEARLGYPVTELSRDKKWGDLDVAKVKQWICIPAMMQYTVWSDVYICEGFVPIQEPTGKLSTRGKNAGKPILKTKKVHRGCNKDFSLWEVAVDLNKGEISGILVCPHCKQQWEKRQLQKISESPVLVTYQHMHLIRTAKATELRAVRKDRRPTKVEIALIQEIQSRLITDWHPTHAIDMGREMMRHGMSKQNLANLGEFWTKRNRWALAKLWAEIQKIANLRDRSALSFAFTAILLRVSRRRIVYCPRGGGWASTVISGTLYIPSLNAEANLWESFENKAEDTFTLASEIHSESSVIIRQGDASGLQDVGDESVDYIFADPPFGQNIYYADCSLLWECWLDNFTDETKEIVVNERRQGGIFKELEDYGNLMGRAFKEMFRVLKPGRWATIEFNNSDGAVFEAIKRGVYAAGFHIENMLLLDKTGKTYKQMKAVVDGEDVVDKDVLFNLRKPSVVRPEVRAAGHDLEQQLAEAVRQHLQTLPERIKAEPAKYNDEHRTVATINSMLMNVLIPRGVNVARLNLPFIERVCSRYFRKVGQRWYLRGEVVGGNGGDLVQEEAAIKDELTAIAWLRQKIAAQPALLGELKPLWMKATGLLPAALSETLVLEHLLLENFWRDSATNRWREPTAEEREKINDDRSLRVLHDAERLADGRLGRTPTVGELCDWIRVLFETCKELEEDPNAQASHLGFDKSNAYRLIVSLSHHLTSDGVEPSLLNAARKQSAVAGRRLVEAQDGTQATAPAKRIKDDKQGRLDLFS
ncbi:MAG: DNA methyltransferase [Verrucomicrobia bacterium]|nr:DNA methyltransferase [Verrucomicrobiota bacterium]